MPFPAEPLPDGAILAPHHPYIGAVAVVLAVLPTMDDHIAVRNLCRRLRPLSAALSRS